jgi:tetratricopeptide (TPR) repeat protein
MAAFPSYESILMEVHQSLAPHCGTKLQTVQKERFAGLDMGLKGHMDLTGKLLGEIFEELGFENGVARDAIRNLVEAFGFHKALELETWTYDADARQIAWHVLGYSIVPGLARRLAFWSLADRIDRGMPGGSFWFLPKLTEEDGQPALSMPVAHVMHWLIDLLGQTIYTIEDETFRKNMYNWRKGDLLDNKSIGAYFSNVTKLDFQGCFVDDGGKTLDERMSEALRFVARKELDANRLRSEIPMTEPGRIESVLEGEAPEADKLRFVELLAERYSPPSCRIIRQRLYHARMVQDGYERLVNLLCPDVDKRCPDPLQNKVLQLIWLFEFSYNLTIDAEKHGRNNAETDAWFENQLPAWLANELFLGILPSQRQNSAISLGFKLTSRFAKCNAGEALEDLFLPDAASIDRLMVRNMMRLVTEAEEARACADLRERIRTGSPYRALQATGSFQAISSIAHDLGIPYRVRTMAVERLQQLELSPRQSLDAVAAELHLYLNNDRKERPSTCQQRVAQLLEKAQASPVAAPFEAIILQYQAKHQLAMSEFEKAEALFKAAFDACQKNAYGSMRGEIARDAFALAVAARPLHPNDERYYRAALFYGQIEGITPTFEDAALAMADYFWEDLYQPYPGCKVETPPLRGQTESLIREPFAFIDKEDWESLNAWMKKNSKLKDKRLRSVRGDTVISLWLKMLHHFERTLPELKVQAPVDLQSDVVRMEQHAARWRQAIGIIATSWTTQLDIADFKGQTPLMLAADRQDHELVNIFLTAGASPDKQDFIGRTALHAAVTGRCERSVRLLLQAKANAGLFTRDEHHTPLHTAIKIGHPEIASELVTYAPGVKECKNIRGETPAMLAEIINSDLRRHASMMGRNGRTIGSASDFMALMKTLC